MDEDAVMMDLAHGGAIAMPGEARPFDVVSSDGLRLSAQSWGDRSRPAIVFIHGFAQAHLCWLRQTRGKLARSFHLVTYDLRGHGGSDKPSDLSRYDKPRLWADDLAAVMDGAQVPRAVLVAWSFGGRCAFDYLAEYGSDRIAGLNLVGAGVSDRPGLRGTGSAALRPLMRSADLSKNIAGKREFLRRCFFRQPDERSFEEMLAYNMITPPEVRGMMLARSGQPEAVIGRMRLPVLVTFGIKDALASLDGARFAASLLPNAELSLYEEVGHAPFHEAPERFNAELRSFADRAFANRAFANRAFANRAFASSPPTGAGIIEKEDCHDRKA
ncbi:MAG: alpha/beta fold hydrolase [Hyphomicrobiales bacterium]